MMLMTAEKTRTPHVSVVIPTRNREQMVAQAVESILTQDFKDYELIVVDDGSTDNTADVLQRYEGSIRLIRQSNRGVSAARNAGIAASRGPLIAFLDSDDLWRPRKLSLQTAFFHAHPNAVVCQTEERWMRNGRQLNPRKYHQKAAGYFFERSLERCLVSPSAAMLRRTVLEEIGGFDENLPACEDYDLWLRIGIRYPIHLINAVLVDKRGGHADQLSAAPGLDRYRIRALLKLIRSGKLNSTQHHAAKMVLLRKCRIYADGCAKRGRLTEAARYRRLMVTGSEEGGGSMQARSGDAAFRARPEEMSATPVAMEPKN